MLLEYAKTDWLGSRPVFYNDKTNKISYEIHEVIDTADIRFHPEGLRNYLRFGYSVYGQTPLEHVKFLRYASEIRKNQAGQLVITEHQDPLENLLGKPSTSEEALEVIARAVQEWEKSISGNIILPLSGGYDSRLLMSDIQDKSRILAYSYGLSRRQEESYEVVRAHKAAEECGVSWKSIKLGGFLRYIDEWEELYGAAIHAHGMYQMEFYKEILKDIAGKEGHLLSGIVGDIWAGNLRVGKLDSIADLEQMGYTHGMNIEEDICLLPDEHDIKAQFWDDNKEKLQEENWRVVFSMRGKIMLLRYLLDTPRAMGLSGWSPFLQENVAATMLNIPWEEKAGRIWQKRYFDGKNLEYGWLKKECDYNMILDENAMRQTKLRPLNEKLLSGILKPEYIVWINRTLQHKPLQSFAAKPRTILNMTNKLIKKANANKIKALYAYEIIYPIQKILEKVQENSID